MVEGFEKLDPVWKGKQGWDLLAAKSSVSELGSQHARAYVVGTAG